MRATHSRRNEGQLTKQNHLLTVLGRRLDALSKRDVWELVIASIVIIAFLDFHVHPYLFLAPLYMLPMCLACWRIGPKIAFVTAFLAAALPLTVGITNGHDLPLVRGIANLALQTIGLGFVAAIVSSFRYTYDREAALSKSDRMTGALNKQAFVERAETMLDAARIENQPLLLLFIDLDGFKAVNDQNGHEAGDVILQSFATEVENAMRRSDSFGRIGGDEFAALLPAETVSEASQIAETLHRRFSQMLAEGPYPITCSVGALIVLPDNQITLPTLIREADQLMYDVKHNGKNGIRISMTDSVSFTKPDSLPLAADQPPLVA